MTIVSQRADAGPLAFDIRIDRHVIRADLPLDAEGTDTGPDPHDLYDAALAACTSITVSKYARRKNWPLRDVQVRVERDASGEQEGHYRLALHITLVGTLDREQRDRLLEIAGKCPIHRLMQFSTDITIFPVAS